MWKFGGRIIAAGKNFLSGQVQKKAMEKVSQISEGSKILEKAKELALIGGSSVSLLALLLITPLLLFLGAFATISIMHAVNPNVKGYGVNLDYDFEEYFESSQNSYETPNEPTPDLTDTEYGDKEGFNQHIQDMVNEAGFGTREGVVAAGVALVGDYIKSTGRRIRYDQGGRQGQDTEGIISENFYLDCSSFAWWALYNGGFYTPCYPYTVTQKEWSSSNGYSRVPGEGVGQGGDFLVSDAHIILIIGTYDDGYYCAEEANWGVGAIISKRSYDSLGGYDLIDMTDYYNDSSNVR